jgi:hypothetical protein
MLLAPNLRPLQASPPQWPFQNTLPWVETNNHGTSVALPAVPVIGPSSRHRATLSRLQNFVIEGQRRLLFLSPISKWQPFETASDSVTGYKYPSDRIAQLARP